MDQIALRVSPAQRRPSYQGALLKPSQIVSTTPGLESLPLLALYVTPPYGQLTCNMIVKGTSVLSNSHREKKMKMCLMSTVTNNDHVAV